MLTELIAALVLIAGDQLSPYMARAYGFDDMPNDDKAEVRAFHKHYGIVRLPRSFFMLAACLFGFCYSDQFAGLGEDFWIWATSLALVLWGAFGFVDIYQARAFAKSHHV